MKLIKPQMLENGDKVAAISLSWGGAGDPELIWKYKQGKAFLEQEFGLRVIETKHALKGTDYIYNHPGKRAEDLMDAFRDPSIKAIFSNVGGDDSIRTLPYIDFDVIRNNPKIFMGMSDTTITHLMCYKAGLSSFYGPCVLVDFSENGGAMPFTKEAVQKTIFSASAPGLINQSPQWVNDNANWKAKEGIRKTVKNTNIIRLGGKDNIVRGRLFGGCIEVLEFAKGTVLWPEAEAFDDAVLFFETSEEKPSPENIEYMLRWYGVTGILHKAKAMIFGKPCQEVYFEEYQKSIMKIAREFSLDIPILYNLPFGHNAPMTVLPYGCLVEVDPLSSCVRIIEPAVTNCKRENK